jgi:mono/diheme cytochrome c family protein
MAGGTRIMDHPERQLSKLGDFVARSLGLPSSIAVGVVSAVLLAGADIGVVHEAAAQPSMASADAARGRALFVSKGCVACHAINEIGGTSGPPLDFEFVPGEVDPLDFVARMWRSAEAMISMQQSLFGAQLDFTGQELADIIAFAHDPREQGKFSEADIPLALRRLIFEQ